MPFEGQPIHLTDAQRDDLEEIARSHALAAGFVQRAKIIRRVAAREAAAHGGDGEQLLAAAVTAGVSAIGASTERLSRKTAKRAIRRSIRAQIPSDNELLEDQDGKLVIVNEARQIHGMHEARLNKAVAETDWESILIGCPVRESGALDQIAKELRFRGRAEYERAVRHLLMEEEEAREWVRLLFGDLAKQLLE